jgi:hypothetical protein
MSALPSSASEGVSLAVTCAEVGGDGTCAEVGGDGTCAEVGGDGTCAEVGGDGTCAEVGGNGTCAEVGGGNGTCAEVGVSSAGSKCIVPDVAEVGTTRRARFATCLRRFTISAGDGVEDTTGAAAAAAEVGVPKRARGTTSFTT